MPSPASFPGQKNDRPVASLMEYMQTPKAPARGRGCGWPTLMLRTTLAGVQEVQAVSLQASPGYPPEKKEMCHGSVLRHLPTSSGYHSFSIPAQAEVSLARENSDSTLMGINLSLKQLFIEYSMPGQGWYNSRLCS